MNGARFLAHVQQVLASSLKPGDVVIVDNLAARLLFLPPYSPNLNPIENAFSRLKALPRQAAARSIAQLWDAIAQIIQTCSPCECANYFTAAGYDAD